jgi:hypothetical protein
MTRKTRVIGHLAILALRFPVLALAQAPAEWRYSRDDDALHGKVHDKLVLEGKYLTAPRSPESGFRPALVVMCSDGKVEQNYISVGAVINSDSKSVFPVHGEIRIDDKKAGSFVGDALSRDGTGVFFTRDDLKKFLKAQRVIVGVNEYLGPQVVMQFDMPSPSPVFAVCGKDRILKAK